MIQSGKRFALVLSGVVLGAAAGQCLAQAGYPSKPVKIIYGYAPGEIGRAHV